MSLYIRKARFQKAVNLLKTTPNLHLTQAGLQAGYYDQSHFINEFKQFSSVTPGRFIKNNSEIKDVLKMLMPNAG